MITETQKLTGSIPLDRWFNTLNGWELCKATGNIIKLSDDNNWYVEYIDSLGNYHYGLYE